jgi:putative transcriptional regulator
MDLAKGKLLVASRQLTDPGFAETVILLLEYSKDGAMGVVLNRSTAVRLATVLPEIKALKNRKDSVSLGGPVGRGQILLLAHSAKPPEQGQHIFGNCYVIASQAALLRLIGAGDPHIKLRAFAGYAGWAAGQLDTEVARNDWHVISADAATVFDSAPAKMWQELIRRSEFEWAKESLPIDGGAQAFSWRATPFILLPAPPPLSMTRVNTSGMP